MVQLYFFSRRNLMMQKSEPGLDSKSFGFASLVAVHRILPHLGTEQYCGDDLHSGSGEVTRPWAAHVVSSKSNEGHGVPWKKARTVLSMKWNTLLPS